MPSEAVNHGSFVTSFAIANVHGRIIGIGMVCSGGKARRKSTGSRTTVTITTKGTNARRGHGTLCYPEFLMDTRRSESDPAPVWWVRRRPGWQGQGQGSDLASGKWAEGGIFF